MTIDGAWWMAAPFLLILLMGIYLLRRRPLLGAGLLASILLPMAATYIWNTSSVSAVNVDGHLRVDDPDVLIAVNVRETPEFYATLLYGGGFGALYLYELPKHQIPEYPFDTPAAAAAVSLTRYERTFAPGCSVYTFDNYPETRQRSSTETYRCLSRTELRINAAQLAAHAIIYAQEATRFRAETARVSGARHEVRRRKNGQDDLVAFHLMTGANDRIVPFLKQALARR